VCPSARLARNFAQPLPARNVRAGSNHDAAQSSIGGWSMPTTYGNSSNFQTANAAGMQRGTTLAYSVQNYQSRFSHRLKPGDSERGDWGRQSAQWPDAGPSSGASLGETKWGRTDYSIVLTLILWMRVQRECSLHSGQRRRQNGTRRLTCYRHPVLTNAGGNTV
jgi:hypothetical protein